MPKDIALDQLRTAVMKERKIVDEINAFYNHLRNSQSTRERKMISDQMDLLKEELDKTGNEVIDTVGRIFMFSPLTKKDDLFDEYEPKEELVVEQVKPMAPIVYSNKKLKRIKMDPIEKGVINRIKKKTKKVVKNKEKKPRKYVQMASNMFHNHATKLINKGKFKELSRDLIKADMEFVPTAYISVIFFTTLISCFAAVLIFFFFLFFNLVVLPPFIVPAQSTLGIRFLKVFWILFFIPAAIYLFTYYYPSMEKKSREGRINEELPFAVVHMSSISSSMIEPSKIFKIIVSTKEYPFLEKEFIKIQNEINVYGYDLVTALRNRSFNSPSKKLAELFNGLATTINSGGDLPDFFDKRAQSLLFDHRLEKEKQARASETFMDIYISAVIAAPMILMLILMMMRISGLGVSLSTGTISLIVILGVSLVNILFLAFLHLKHPENA